jgi:hypothetical protein
MKSALSFIADLPTPVKFLISAAWDVIDFFIPPGIEAVTDVGAGVLCLALWEAPVLSIIGTGIEATDITGRADGFIPTLTITGIIKTLR